MAGWLVFRFPVALMWGKEIAVLACWIEAIVGLGFRSELGQA